MSTPTLIKLKGTYVKADPTVPSGGDKPESGKVVIVSEDYISNSTADFIVPPFKTEATLDSTGHFETTVISTNDPAWLPVNRTLVIKEVLSGGTRTYRIAVPHDAAGGVIDLADVAPVTDPTLPIGYILVTSFQAKGDILVATGPGTFARLPVGANSQVLTADSSTPTGTRWVSGGGGGGGISPTIINAKGDLIVGVADDIPDRLGVGTNGQFLKANSATGTGLEWIAPTKSDVGLSNVDNTSDAGKPISTATQTALNGKAASVHTHAQSDVTGLTTALANKSDIGHTHAQSDVTGLTAALAAKAPTADPAFTGAATAEELTLSKRMVVSPDTITINAGNADTDASLGNHFKITANANFTLTNPTNPADTQKIVWQITQDGAGGRTITLGTAFALGTDIASVTLSTAAGKCDYLGAIYDATAAKWRVVMFVRGY